MDYFDFQMLSKMLSATLLYLLNNGLVSDSFPSGLLSELCIYKDTEFKSGYFTHFVPTEKRGYPSALERTWLEAQKLCRAEGGTLASITSKTELSKVQEKINEFNVRSEAEFWIGLNDRDYEDCYVWTDGKCFSFKPWSADARGNKKNEENCAVLYRGSDRSATGLTFRDTECSRKLPVICKKKDVCYDNKCKYGECSPSKTSYSCKCKAGWTGQYCDRDIDECVAGTSKCEQLCNNNAGSFTCQCRSGFKLRDDRRTCTDLSDPCQVKDHGCQHVCIKVTTEKWKCDCYHGYDLAPDKTSCISKYKVGSYRYELVSSFVPWTEARDHCRKNHGDLVSLYNLREEEKVKKVVGWFYTKYWIGLNDLATEGNWVWSDASDNTWKNWKKGEPNNAKNADCAVMDEGAWDDIECRSYERFVCKYKEYCFSSPCKNGGKCEERPKGFACKCALGYQGATCVEDVDECDLDKNTCEQICINTFGSYTCGCRAGYVLEADKSNCRAVSDMCSLGTHGCQHICRNDEKGGFKCECFRGYELAANGKNCEDINECGTSNGGCQQMCVNVPGSFKCTCNEKMLLSSDGKSCQDFDLSHQRYYISEQITNWRRAEVLCKRLNGDLLSIHNEEEMERISQLIDTGTSYWIGLNDRKKEGTFQWSSYSRSKYRNWASGEPSNSGLEDCVMIVKSKYGINAANMAKFKDLACDNDDLKFICKLNGHVPIIPGHVRFIPGPKSMTWGNAEQFCQSHGGHLLSTVTERESALLNSELSHDEYWLGLSDVAKEGNFRWAAGGMLGGYSNWMEGHPRRGFNSQDCVSISYRNNWKWKDVSCYEQKNFMCKIEYFVNGLSRYHISKAPMTWLDSQSFCLDLGGSLASVTNGDEQEFIVSSLIQKGETYWLGGKSDDKAKASWVDGTYFGYTSWRKGSLNRGCIAASYFSRGLWTAENCDDFNYAICKVNFFQVKQSKFMLETKQMSWQAAEDQCSKKGGHLASFISEQEQSFISKLASNDVSYWIGMSGDKGGNFRWSDGSIMKLDKLDRVYTSGLDCVYYNPSEGNWVNNACSTKRAHICKIPEYPVTEYDYHIVGKKMTWHGARRYCWRMSGDLASITSEAEQKHIEQRIDLDISHWIGLSDSQKSSVFLWSDGEPYGYKNLEKKLVQDRCYNIGAGLFGEWAASNCFEKKSFVCKVPKYQTAFYKYSLIYEHTAKTEAEKKCTGRGGVLLAARVKDDQACMNLTGKTHDQGSWISQACKMDFTYACKTSKFVPSNSTYLIPEERLNWDQAKIFCQQRGGALVDIKSEEEAKHVETLMKNDVQYWIGLNDRAIEKKFEWPDHSGVNYALWDFNEPSSNPPKRTPDRFQPWHRRNYEPPEQDCVCMKKTTTWHSGTQVKWSDDKCPTQMSFMCKIPLSPLETYYISNYQRSYDLAKEACLYLGGDLTSVFDTEEQEHILSLARPNREYWIGYNKRNGGSFSWEDESISTFTSFANGEPSGDGKCVTMRNGQWNDVPCTHAKYFICKKGLVPDQDRFKLTRMSGMWDQVTYSHADGVCKKQGGHVASASTRRDERILESLISGNTFWTKIYWIGLTDSQREGTFVWSDKRPLKYTNWKTGEPNGGRNENCVVIENNRWLDVSCKREGHYICRSPNRCYRAPCTNLGTCKSLAKKYQCVCKPHFDGDNCEDGSKAIEELRKQIQAAFNHLMAKNREGIAQLARDLYDSKAVGPCAEQNYRELYCKLVQGKHQLKSDLEKVKEATSSGWSNEEAKLRRAALLAWLTIHGVKVDGRGMNQLSKDVLELIYQLVRQNNVKDLKMFGSYVPPTELKLAKTKTCELVPTNPLGRDMNCIFTDAMRSVHNYLKFIRSSTPNSKSIQTRYDLQTKLHLAKLNNIRDEAKGNTLTIQASLFEFSRDLQKFIDASIGSRFAALESYFKKLADFDRRKNQADVGYIKGRLEFFDTDIKNRQDVVWEKINAMTIGACAAATADVVQKTVEAIKQSAFSWSPFKIMGGFNDVADRWNAVAIAGVNLIRSTRVRIAYQKMVNKAWEIQKKLAKNAERIEVARALVDLFDKKFIQKKSVKATQLDKQVDAFLKLYGDYDPALKKQELDEFGTLLGAVVDETCEMLFAGSTTASAVVQAVFAGRGDCLLTGSKVEGLISVYNEMYDYQFDMWESLAKVVRAHVALTSAEALNTQFKRVPNNTPKEYTKEIQSLRQMSLTLLIVSRIHTIQLVSQFCDYAEYMNAGKRPRECVDAIQSLSDSAIDSLTALRPVTCSHVQELEVKIPTKPAFRGDKGYINLKELYSGKVVPFQIPDTNWLLQYGWIFKGDDVNRAYYIRDLKLFIPDLVDHVRTIRVSITTSGAARLLPSKSSIQYYLSGNDVTQINFAYKENLSRCPGTKIPSPYNVCRTKNMELCTVVETSEKSVHPSVFSDWRVHLKLQDDKATNVTMFTTSPLIRADVKMCVMCVGQGYADRPSCVRPAGRKVSDSITSFVKATVPEECCLNSNSTIYWNHAVRQCSTCPNESKASANGYYCFV